MGLGLPVKYVINYTESQGGIELPPRNRLPLTLDRAGEICWALPPAEIRIAVGID